ncbi:hypothetical protein OEA41_000166 [Lepraria neglecta]|uniref:VWFA domain-containing protein n=1 Tax=Lepraria neglecta TaxID=209136 RepID=A0AAD9ZF90_9LECA|nr:hypothetical protein OEA41_000166 [Lepraria neglecta]
MSSFNIFRKKSRKNSGFIDGTPSNLSATSNLSAPKSPFAAFSAPTRRPANPATVENPFATPSNDSPPSYTAPATSLAPSTDNPYAFLTTFDTIFLIDDSGSMAGRSWRETSAALAAITPICTAHDKDGIDIHFLNARDEPSYSNITSPVTVQRIFDTVRPSGGTLTGTRLNAILKPYLKECELKKNNFDAIKPLNIIVITDGVPTDDPESVIVSVAKKLDKLEAPPWQVGIQFFQVGEEKGAAEALEDLDDGLKDANGGIRDIVDTVPWKGTQGTGLNADGILKVVLGSVNKRLDRKRISLDGRPGQGPS